MEPNELSDLKARCLFAHSHGFSVAHAENHAALLAKECGGVELPAGAEPNSPAHLLALIHAVESGVTAKPSKAEKAAKAAAEKAAKAAAEKAAAEKAAAEAEAKAAAEAEKSDG